MYECEEGQFRISPQDSQGCKPTPGLLIETLRERIMGKFLCFMTMLKVGKGGKLRPQKRKVEQLLVRRPRWLRGEEPACNVGDMGLIPGLGWFPGEGNGNPLQYSYLENPMDRGTWQATYSPWGLKRVGHDLATKQQQLLVHQRFWSMELRHSLVVKGILRAA